MATALSLSLKAAKPSLTGAEAIQPASPTRHRKMDCVMMMASATLTLCDFGFIFESVEKFASGELHQFRGGGTADGIEDGLVQRLDASVYHEETQDAHDGTSEHTPEPDGHRQFLVGQEQTAERASRTKNGHNPSALA